MSAVWFRLITCLCLSSTALGGPGSSGVLWRDVGGAVTIQCRWSEPDQEYLFVKKGLSEDVSVLYKEGNSDKITIAKEFTGRLQVNGAFPNVDILIKNLSSEDTGPYWCLYKRFDLTSHEFAVKKGTGSVLLVVKADTQPAQQECEPSYLNPIWVSVVICTAVPLSIIMGVLICLILKTKTVFTTVESRQIFTSDAYENMPETLRSGDVSLQVTNQPETP